ncbi:hypothetical protein KOR42_19990 [Thalassoglobus neptunius]|uniref:Uncharacterized protein n=1 Tax=Thalassoglobus neptunius TaxID=1938619 RepID=A0A5C5X676_9PLAN|nr:hypothetical protein KOR42_19990 [Thalassoglobus neptunius]
MEILASMWEWFTNNLPVFCFVMNTYFQFLGAYHRRRATDEASVSTLNSHPTEARM